MSLPAPPLATAAAGSRPGAAPRAGQGLQRRFLVLVVAGATAFAALAGALAYAIGQGRAHDNGRATVDALLAAVERTAAAGAYAADPVVLQEIVHGVARNPLVRVAEVRVGGRPLARALGTAAGSAEGTAESNTEGAAIGGGERLHVRRLLASPFDAQEMVGTLEVEINGHQLQTAARHEASLLALLMIGQTLLVALLLYQGAARFVSQPIVRLAAALRAMTPGTGARLNTPRRHAGDEVGTLIAGANALLDANEQALQRERGLRAEIETMEAQYRQIFDSSSAGIFVLDAQGRLINSNPTALRIIGLPLATMQNMRGGDFVRRVFARPERLQDMMNEAATRHETVSADLELLGSDHAGRWVHCLISVQEAARTGRLVEGVMYDITERKRQESEVRHRAEHDALTGLKNRAALETAIDRFVQAATLTQSAVSLVYIDLDGFKQINDSLGHKAGDRVLQQCAARMQSALRRSSDLVGRIGGDEFVLLLNHVGPGDAALTETAALVLERLCQPIELDGGQLVQVGASMGIACFPRHGCSRRQLLQAADAAMYEVKRSGKNSFALAVAEPASA